MLDHIGNSSTRSFVATVPQCSPQLAHSVTSPLADPLPLSVSHNLLAWPASDCYQVPLATEPADLDAGRRQLGRQCWPGTQAASGRLAGAVQPRLARASEAWPAGMPTSRATSRASRASRPARQAARPSVIGTSRVGEASSESGPRMLRTRAATQT